MYLSNEVTERLNTILSMLQEVLADTKTNPTHLTTNPMGIVCASTTEVQQITGHYFYWKPLRDYCKQHNLPIMKVNVNGLEINSYPSSAWADVYDVNIFNVLTNK